MPHEALPFFELAADDHDVAVHARINLRAPAAVIHVVRLRARDDGSIAVVRLQPADGENLLERVTVVSPCTAAFRWLDVYGKTLCAASQRSPCFTHVFAYVPFPEMSLLPLVPVREYSPVTTASVR